MLIRARMLSYSRIPKTRPGTILYREERALSQGNGLVDQTLQRGIRHVVLCDLATIGVIPGSARHGADLYYHVVIPRSGVMDDEGNVNDFILQVLLKFVDTFDMKDLFTGHDGLIVSPWIIIASFEKKDTT